MNKSIHHSFRPIISSIEALSRISRSSSSISKLLLLLPFVVKCESEKGRVSGQFLYTACTAKGVDEQGTLEKRECRNSSSSQTAAGCLFVRSFAIHNCAHSGASF